MTTRAFAALAIVLMLAGGCRSLTGQSLGQNISDRTTTGEVKTRLSLDRWKNITWLDVDTNDGTVYLSGNVETQQQKQRAEQIARSVEGVENVVNNLKVQSRTVRTASDRDAEADRTDRAMAQPRTGSAAASPPMAGGLSLGGEVVSVDRSAGRLLLRTPQGDVTLQMPAGVSLPQVERGDRVMVDINPTR